MCTIRSRALVAVVGAIAVLAGTLARGQTGVSASEQTLRVARRLAAERSADAGAAFAKLVADHPGDPLADDALVEHAAWLGAPVWPEDLAGLEGDNARRAFGLLQDAVRADGDRRHEAACRLALLTLGSGVGGDAGTDRALALAAARRHLIGVATAEGARPWSDTARYVLAWADEGAGEIERSRAAYQRLVIDEPESEAGRRAAVGLGRTLLRLGAAGRAAAHLQKAVERGTAPVLGADDLRESAVRTLLRSTSAAARWGDKRPRVWASGARGGTAIAGVPSGGTLVADRRGRVVTLFDGDGSPTQRWALDDVSALAVDPLGRIYAAAGSSIVRLAAGNRIEAVATQGEFAPVSALAADASGRLFVADRRGDRIGRVEPGAAAPTLLRERRGAGFSSMTWDGTRLLAGEAKTGRVVEIRDDGSERPAVVSQATSVAALAVDAAGSIAVVDSRADTVFLFAPAGEVLDSFRYGAAGFGRITGAAFRRRGDLELFEGSTGNVLRLP